MHLNIRDRRQNCFEAAVDSLLAGIASARDESVHARRFHFYDVKEHSQVGLAGSNHLDHHHMPAKKSTRKLEASKTRLAGFLLAEVVGGSLAAVRSLEDSFVAGCSNLDLTF